METFRSECNDVISWISRPNYFPGFTEGWATYAEYPLMTNDTDIYNNTTDKDIILQKYGMLKYQVMSSTIAVSVSVTMLCCHCCPLQLYWAALLPIFYSPPFFTLPLIDRFSNSCLQILAALRTFLDVSINYYSMSRMEAELIYHKYAWGSSTVAFKDITRFQSSPGVVTSYMIGQMTFVKARKLMEESLGPRFSLPEFHYQVLRQGEIPLEYLLKYIRDLSDRWPYRRKRKYFSGELTRHAIITSGFHHKHFMAVEHLEKTFSFSFVMDLNLPYTLLISQFRSL